MSLSNQTGRTVNRLVAAASWIAQAEQPPAQINSNWMAAALRRMDADPLVQPSAPVEALFRSLDKLSYSLLAVSVRFLFLR